MSAAAAVLPDCLGECFKKNPLSDVSKCTSTEFTSAEREYLVEKEFFFQLIV